MKGLNNKETSIPTVINNVAGISSSAEREALLSEMFGKNFNSNLPSLLVI